MPRRPHNWIASLLLVLLLLSGCQSALAPLTTLALDALQDQAGVSAQPLILPSADVTIPAQQDEETPTEGESADEWELFVAEESDLDFYHPGSWSVFDPSTADLETIVAAANHQLAADDLRQMLARLASPQASQALLAVGLLLDETREAHPEYVNNVLLTEVPADGLMLDLYARLVKTQLEQRSPLTIQEADAIAGLRPYGEEVASVRYAISGALHGLDEPLAGWQVGVLSDGGDRLLVITFTTVASDFDALEPTFFEMIERIEY